MYAPWVLAALTAHAPDVNPFTTAAEPAGEPDFLMRELLNAAHTADIPWLRSVRVVPIDDEHGGHAQIIRDLPGGGRLASKAIAYSDCAPPTDSPTLGDIVMWSLPALRTACALPSTRGGSALCTELKIAEALHRDATDQYFDATHRELTRRVTAQLPQAHWLLVDTENWKDYPRDHGIDLEAVLDLEGHLLLDCTENNGPSWSGEIENLLTTMVELDTDLDWACNCEQLYWCDRRLVALTPEAEAAEAADTIPSSCSRPSDAHN